MKRFIDSIRTIGREENVTPGGIEGVPESDDGIGTVVEPSVLAGSVCEIKAIRNPCRLPQFVDRQCPTVLVERLIVWRIKEDKRGI